MIPAKKYWNCSKQVCNDNPMVDKCYKVFYLKRWISAVLILPPYSQVVQYGQRKCVAGSCSKMNSFCKWTDGWFDVLFLYSIVYTWKYKFSCSGTRKIKAPFRLMEVSYFYKGELCWFLEDFVETPFFDLGICML